MSVVKYVYVHKQRYGRIYNKNFTWQSVGLYVSSKLYKVNIHCFYGTIQSVDLGTFSTVYSKDSG